MKSLLLLLVTVAAVGSSPTSFFDLSDYTAVVHEEWNAYKLEHKKWYESETEERLRIKIFAESKMKVAQHNQRFDRGEEFYRLAINQFSDMMEHEFTTTMCGYKRRNKTNTERVANYISGANLVSEIDWRTLGAVTPVKNQGQCASCWAFSATGALEGQHFRKTGSLVSLSEQNLIDCDNYDNGCRWGEMEKAFKYIQENNGIDYESTYPYEAVKKQCRYTARDKGADDMGYLTIGEGNEDELKKSVAQFGPISIAVHATGDFKHHSSGIFFGKGCNTALINHAMLVVGYGADEDGVEYWLVKNSYGPKWGEEGYIRMARNRNNLCGIASEAVYPKV